MLGTIGSTGESMSGTPKRIVIPAPKNPRPPLTDGQRAGGIIGAALVSTIGAGGILHNFRTQNWSVPYGVTALALTMLVGSALGFGMGVSTVMGVSWLNPSD